MVGGCTSPGALLLLIASERRLTGLAWREEGAALVAEARGRTRAPGWNSCRLPLGSSGAARSATASHFPT